MKRWITGGLVAAIAVGGLVFTTATGQVAATNDNDAPCTEPYSFQEYKFKKTVETPNEHKEYRWDIETRTEKFEYKYVKETRSRFAYKHQGQWGYGDWSAWTVWDGGSTTRWENASFSQEGDHDGNPDNDPSRWTEDRDYRYVQTGQTRSYNPKQYTNWSGSGSTAWGTGANPPADTSTTRYVNKQTNTVVDPPTITTEFFGGPDNWVTTNPGAPWVQYDERSSTGQREVPCRKIEICHRDQGKPGWKVIEINENALDAHLEHQWGEDIYPVPAEGCPRPEKPSYPPLVEVTDGLCEVAGQTKITVTTTTTNYKAVFNDSQQVWAWEKVQDGDPVVVVTERDLSEKDDLTDCTPVREDKVTTSEGTPECGDTTVGVTTTITSYSYTYERGEWIESESTIISLPVPRPLTEAEAAELEEDCAVLPPALITSYDCLSDVHSAVLDPASSDDWTVISEGGIQRRDEDRLFSVKVAPAEGMHFPGMDTDEPKRITAEFAAEVDDCEVTVAAPTLTPPTCTTAGTVLAPNTDDYTWSNEGNTYTANPTEGRRLVGQTVFEMNPLPADNSGEECAPEIPEPTVERRDNGQPGCGDTTIEVTVTTVTWGWEYNDETGEWDPTSASSIQTETRELLPSEIKNCPPEPKIEAAVFSPTCQADIPYISYEIKVSGTSASTAKLTFADKTGKVVATHVGVPLKGSVIFPGASASPKDWPGWKQAANGNWIEDPTDAISREGLTVTVEVNPTTTAAVTYPAATTACANPATPPPPPATPTGIIPTTGSSVQVALGVGAILAALGVAMLLIRRRKPTTV